MTVKKAILVAGLGFGDEGKGTIVDFLTRFYRASAVIRYNGGPQAGHNVVLRDGRQHVFSQFGSGTFVPGVKTHLSRFMLVAPTTMLNEERHLQQIGITDAFKKTSIDNQAVIVTPYHKAANRLREISRGPNKHGSCGMGVGETLSDRLNYRDQVLTAGDLKNINIAKQKLGFIRELKLKLISELDLPRDGSLIKDIVAVLKDDTLFADTLLFYRTFSKLANVVEADYFVELARENIIIFEGAQGLLLDPVHGFKPHVTKTDITFNNALTLLKEINYQGEIRKIGVLRAYFTRHGAGPFPTEDAQLTRLIPDSHNPENRWQDKFRIGWFDAVNTRYAIDCIGGVNEIAITNADRLIGLLPVKVCIDFQNGQPVYEEFKRLDSIADAIKYLKFLQETIKTPITTTSFGPRAEDKLVPYSVH